MRVLFISVYVLSNLSFVYILLPRPPSLVDRIEGRSPSPSMTSSGSHDGVLSISLDHDPRLVVSRMCFVIFC